MHNSSEEESHRDVHLEPLPSQFGLSSSSSTVIHVTMYVLLGIFGLALAIFVVNCFFYVANDSNRKSKMTNIFVGKSATIKEVRWWWWWWWCDDDDGGGDDDDDDDDDDDKDNGADVDELRWWRHG